ncbi:MAG: aminotransferase class IV [Chitinophagaceae bacterium]|nr:aminotransferase class IV [Chitinophagaceae bacterium]
MWCFLNGEWMDMADAKLAINDLGIQRGYGVFDFFRVMNNAPLFIDDHLVRLQRSASVMHLQHGYSSEEFKTIVNELIHKNQMPSSGIRITITGGYTTDSYSISQPNIIITQTPVVMQDDFSQNKAFRLITHNYVRDLPSVKSINYMMGVWLQPVVKAAGADDVLYVKNNFISELPRSNIFIITKQGMLITPNEQVLKGVTRKNILQAASSIMQVKERAVSLEELHDAEEVFISATTKRVIPVVEVDGKMTGDGKPGKRTAAIFELLLQKEKQSTGCE